MTNSKRLLGLLSAITRLTERDGVVPSFRDLADETGSSVSMVAVRIRKLKELGLVSARDKTARSVRVTGLGTKEVA